jgi:cell division protein FtsW
MTNPTPRTPHTSGSQHHDSKTAGALVAVKRVFGAETGNFFLLLGTTIFLVAFGLIMVLSSSSVESIAQNGNYFSSPPASR